MSTIVIYHADCPDGFGAAFAAWLVFGDSAQYVPARFGEPAPDVRGKEVYILDFSYPPEVLSHLTEQASSLTLLDHHATAKEMLSGFRCDCARLHFDLEQSGAMLAWKHFHPHKNPPKLIQHIQDRDLWHWKLEKSADFLAALDVLPKKFEAWQTVMEMDEEAYAQFCERGRAMNEKFEALCAGIAEKARPIRLLGHEGLAVNASSEFTSRVGNLLANRCGTFAAVWYVDDRGVKVGLRSIAPFEVHKMAQHFGGGGHPQASGFTLPLEKLSALLSGEL